MVGYLGRSYEYSGKNQLSIAIECGDNKAEKIEALRSAFPLVLILPYKEFDVLEQPEIKLIRKMTKDWEQQTISNYYYLKELQSIEERFSTTEKIINDKIEQVGIQLSNRIQNDFKERVQAIESSIIMYEEQLKCLKEFKDWCVKFSLVGR